LLFNPIQTDRLILRRLTLEDAEAVYSYRSNPEVSKYQMWHPKSIDDVHHFLKSLIDVSPDTPGTWLQLAIVSRDDNVLIGDCGIRFPEEETYQAELGISLTPSCHGEGFGREALQAVMGYLFDSLHKHRVFASVDPRNLAAIALMDRVKMRHEAHFRESILLEGEWVDDVIYAMLEHEWRGRKP